ncbi:MAG: hypothetical protein ABIM88_09260 [candidate division WOR-3 bacterium]
MLGILCVVSEIIISPGPLLKTQGTPRSSFVNMYGFNLSLMVRVRSSLVLYTATEYACNLRAFGNVADSWSWDFWVLATKQEGPILAYVGGGLSFGQDPYGNPYEKAFPYASCFGPGGTTGLIFFPSEMIGVSFWLSGRAYHYTRALGWTISAMSIADEMGIGMAVRF